MFDGRRFGRKKEWFGGKFRLPLCSLGRSTNSNELIIIFVNNGNKVSSPS